MRDLRIFPDLERAGLAASEVSADDFRRNVDRQRRLAQSRCDTGAFRDAVGSRPGVVGESEVVTSKLGRCDHWPRSLSSESRCQECICQEARLPIGVHAQLRERAARQVKEPARMSGRKGEEQSDILFPVQP